LYDLVDVALMLTSSEEGNMGDLIFNTLLWPELLEWYALLGAIFII
jgi:hypothetical protein